MAIPVLGILVGDSGVTALSLLATGPGERASALGLLEVIRPEIEAFDRRLKGLLKARAPKLKEARARRLGLRPQIVPGAAGLAPIAQRRDRR